MVQWTPTAVNSEPHRPMNGKAVCQTTTIARELSVTTRDYRTAAVFDPFWTYLSKFLKTRDLNAVYLAKELGWLCLHRSDDAALWIAVSNAIYDFIAASESV